MLARLVVPALLALAFASWHWSQLQAPAEGGTTATVSALDAGDDGTWASSALPGRGPVVAAIASAWLLLLAPTARPRPGRRIVALRTRAPPSD